MPGDVVVIEEGDRVAADIRLLAGAVEVDMSALTGEVCACAALGGDDRRECAVADCARFRYSVAPVVPAGMPGSSRSPPAWVREIRRIAALSERVKPDTSPLERQVRRAAWLIAAVSVMLGLSFIPLATLVAHLTLINSLIFAAGLLAGMVPEELYGDHPCVGGRGAGVGGSWRTRETVVRGRNPWFHRCDLHRQNRHADPKPDDTVAVWTTAGHIDLRSRPSRQPRGYAAVAFPSLRSLGRIAARCNNGRFDDSAGAMGDPTEVAVLAAARILGAETDPATREANRRWQFHFDPELKLMSTIDGPMTDRPSCTPKVSRRRC